METVLWLGIQYHMTSPGDEFLEVRRTTRERYFYILYMNTVKWCDE